MTELKIIEGSIIGNKYKPGIEFSFKLAIPCAEQEEYALLVEHDGQNAANVNALLRLADMTGVDHAQTLAVGDSKNDSDMLAAAGLGLAVSNAWEELKAVADVVIPCSNDEHVAPYLLEHYFKKP